MYTLKGFLNNLYLRNLLIHRLKVYLSYMLSLQQLYTQKPFHLLNLHLLRDKSSAIHILSLNLEYLIQYYSSCQIQGNLELND